MKVKRKEYGRKSVIKVGKRARKKCRMKGEREEMNEGMNAERRTKY